MSKQDEIHIVCHFSEDPEDQKELARRVSVIQAQCILNFLSKLPYSPQDKQKLLTQFIEDERKRYEAAGIVLEDE